MKAHSHIVPVLLALFLGHLSMLGQQAVDVTINVASEPLAISPYIFGKNNSLSDNPSKPLTPAQWQRLKDLGINLFRENGGNNASKYNWRLKLSSHPDWYNNVYAHNWDYAALSLEQNIPWAQGMWGFQLTGKAAKTTSQNFNDWAYNGSNWWSGVGQNLAGGGTPNPDGGSKALVEGNTDLYLENWNEDSTTGILKHWFGPGGLGLDSNKVLYWNMDNEPEIWNGTHDDIWPVQPDAEAFMQRYFAVAKKARQQFPGIKLMGPIPANEWQWFNYKSGKISYAGSNYVWLEYFIKRISEEQKATGIRLLDVMDLHFYPGEKNTADILQLHRVFFDQNYIYPGANGVKVSGPTGWDNSINKEYIFKRINDWLVKYLGPDHGVKLSVSEMGIENAPPSVTACWYASTLGEFARNGVTLFTPWSWKTGMDEVIHLFSRYHLPYILRGLSSDETYVSAYPTINYQRDSMVVFFVNRHLTETRTINLTLKEFPVKDGNYDLYTLSGLPATETFVSHTINALKKTSVSVTESQLSLEMQPLSIAALVLKRNTPVVTNLGTMIDFAEAESGILQGVNKGTNGSGYSGSGYVTGLDATGDRVTVNVTTPSTGFYRVVVYYRGTSGDKSQDLSVNSGAPSTVFFPGSSGFVPVEAGSFMMNKGVNTISLIKNWGWDDIDRFEIYPGEPHRFLIDSALVDSNADAVTRDLYQFLKLQFRKRIISGQTDAYFSELSATAGSTPMIQGGDLSSYTEGYPYAWDNTTGSHTFGAVDNGTVSKLINWYNNAGKKGIVTLHWHWCSPTGGTAGTNTFYTEYTTFDITRAVTPGTQEYADIIRDIDAIAVQLKKFQDAGVPILWRPLHEAGGGWFWWGAKGPAACKALYNLLYDRLQHYHQLHNLIWVWSTPETTWYPGNDKVDIIGYDSYPGNFNYGAQKTSFDRLFELTAGKKLIAMSENGPIPDPDECLNYDAPWLYFMSWSNLVSAQNSSQHIKDVFHHAAVITLESNNAKTNSEWRSSLYPEDWKPGYRDAQGRFLHDFSYAGYHQGMDSVPYRDDLVVDVTQSPYFADNTGNSDVTEVVQQAINDASASGGGVVYLPAGTYRIHPPDGAMAALRVQHDSVVIRGAGPGKTFLLNDSYLMRKKDIIRFGPSWAGWFDPVGTPVKLSLDLLYPTKMIPVENINSFRVGDEVVVASSITSDFIAEHKMTDYWDSASLKGVAFFRKIEQIDTANHFLILNAPTRYFLKKRDYARVYHVAPQLHEVGLENLSLGNVQCPDSGWGEEDYDMEGTGAWEVHGTHAVSMQFCADSWIKKVHTYQPAGNTLGYHLLSNGVFLDQSSNITVDSCVFSHPQYLGGGGNGYMYIMQSNNCLIRNSAAVCGRHNYDFKFPYSNGNVVLHCRGEKSRYASDFHMYLSMANLFDDCSLNEDFLESAFRPYGSPLHGYTSTQSVFYNTHGEAYHSGKNYIIDSRQFGWGYIIGTSGPADSVITSPVEGVTEGVYFNSEPIDFTEGIGEGSGLRPASLYLDQLQKRKANPAAEGYHRLKVVLSDQGADTVLPGVRVSLYEDSRTTNENGLIDFGEVPELLTFTIQSALFNVPASLQFVIQSDTTLEISLPRKIFHVTFRLLDAKSLTPFWGVNAEMGGVKDVSDASGNVQFDVKSGRNFYSIDKLSYARDTGQLFVAADTSLVFYLERVEANIKFRLKNGATPVNLASVIINQDTILSNALGISLFSNLPVSNSYAYLILKDGYESLEGLLFLETDTTLDLQLTKKSWIDHSATSSIRLWPNPVKELLYLSMGENSHEVSCVITDLPGHQLFSGKLNGPSFSLNVSFLKPGSYVMSVSSSSGRSNCIFVKE